VVEDAEAGCLNDPPSPDAADCEEWLKDNVPGLVTWEGWQAIDTHEQGLGEPHGRPRVKLVRVPEMIAVAEGTRAPQR
jgi:ferredoxin--NADP+ reductase